MDKAFLGYNFSCPIDGNVIPQRLQNLCIRDYALTKKLTVSFSVSEYSDARQSLMLFNQFKHIDEVAGIVFFSLLLLPPDRERRKDFYKRVTAKGKVLHFALEDLAWDPAGQSADYLERLYLISLDKRLEETREVLIHMKSLPGQK